MTRPRPALLLVGPSGSGKTPLGHSLEKSSLWGRKCLHFDFGNELRGAAAMKKPLPPLELEDLDAIRSVLASGALLEDSQFRVAERILRSFLSSRNPGPDRLIVLNGMPRHVGQAEMIGSIVDIKCVALLSCSTDVAWDRIRFNLGGDRQGRNDDGRESVQNKLEVFGKRTLPLLDYYRSRGVPVLTIETDTVRSGNDIRRQLERTPCPPGLARPGGRSAHGRKPGTLR